MMGSAGLSGSFAPVRRPALAPFLGVLRRVLIRRLREREALNPHSESRLVHHDKHRLQAAVLRRYQPPGGAVVIHHACCVAMDAHFVFDRAA